MKNVPWKFRGHNPRAGLEFIILSHGLDLWSVLVKDKSNHGAVYTKRITCSIGGMEVLPLQQYSEYYMPLNI
jgi:hypothetical protein